MIRLHIELATGIATNRYTMEIPESCKMEITYVDGNAGLQRVLSVRWCNEGRDFHIFCTGLKIELI